jgi:hypothetical protein
LCRFDHDGLLFGTHHLLRRALKAAVGLCLMAQALYRIHHGGLLIGKGIANLLRPIELGIRHG